VFEKLRKTSFYNPFPPEKCKNQIPMISILSILFLMMVVLPAWSTKNTGLIVPGFMLFLCCAFLCSYSIKATKDQQKIAFLKMRQHNFNLLLGELNRGLLSSKSASMTVGSFGAYLVLTTWDTRARERNNDIMMRGMLGSGLLTDQ
jgi:hypothetical protein